MLFDVTERPATIPYKKRPEEYRQDTENPRIEKFTTLDDHVDPLLHSRKEIIDHRHRNYAGDKEPEGLQEFG